MNNTLFCIYDGQKYLAEPIDDNHIYILNYDTNVKKLKINLNDKKLTNFYNTTFLFTLDDKVQDSSMPGTWELTPNMVDLDGQAIGLMWGKDKNAAPSLENMNIAEVGYNMLDMTCQQMEWIKKNGHLNKNSKGEFKPREETRELDTASWFQKYFEVENFKHPSLQNSMMANSLKRQYALNPAYTIDDLMVSNNQILAELNKESPNVKHDEKYIQTRLCDDWNIFNEFKYYTNRQEYVPDVYAYQIFGITAQKLSNKYDSNPINAFISLHNLIIGDTLSHFMHFAAQKKPYKTMPKLRKFLNE